MFCFCHSERSEESQRLKYDKSVNYYVYILTNKTHTVLYTGVTNNLVRRIFEHLNKSNKSFTSKYNISKLVYFSEFKYVQEAIQSEKIIKGWTRQKKVDLITSLNPEWHDLISNR